MGLDDERDARRSAHSESLPEERAWHTGHPGYGQGNRRAKIGKAGAGQGWARPPGESRGCALPPPQGGNASVRRRIFFIFSNFTRGTLRVSFISSRVLCFPRRTGCSAKSAPGAANGRPPEARGKGRGGPNTRGNTGARNPRRPGQGGFSEAARPGAAVGP